MSRIAFEIHLSIFIFPFLRERLFHVVSGSMCRMMVYLTIALLLSMYVDTNESRAVLVEKIFYDDPDPMVSQEK